MCGGQVGRWRLTQRQKKFSLISPGQGNLVIKKTQQTSLIKR